MIIKKNRVIELNKREVFLFLFLTQVLLAVLALVYYFTSELEILDGYYKNGRSDFFIFVLLFLCGFVGLIALYWLKEMNEVIENEKNYLLQTIKLQQMEEANDLLSIQKHDFLNNLQVIWGLVILSDKEKAVEYIKKVTDTLKYEKIELTEISKDENPYLYTLLINKLHKCKELDIDMDLNLYDTEYLNTFNPIDIVNIFGNILDNAIYEVKKLPKDARKICVDIYNEEEYINIEIFNRGPQISEDIIKNMFVKGFTTKGDAGSGIGLYNVKNIVEKYGGSINISSEEDYGTNFTISFLKKEENVNS